MPTATTDENDEAPVTESDASEPTTRSKAADDGDGRDRLDRALTRLRRWGVRLVALVVVVGVVLALLNVAVSVGTQVLWFRSVDAGDVYTTILRTQVLLFAVFGGAAAVLGGLSAFVVQRFRPLPAPVGYGREDEEDDDDFVSSLDVEERPGWRRWVEDHPRLVRRAVLLLAIVVPAVRIGSRATHQWQAFQLWRHAAPWGVTDPTFGRDLSYYVEVYPMHRVATNLAMSVLVWAIGITVVAAILHGSLRWRGPRRVSRPVVAQVSLLLAAWLVVRAYAYWLDRAALVTSQRDSYTGVSYTDLNAVAPGKIVLIAISALLVLILLVNVVRGRFRLLVLAVVLAVVASGAVGTAWPNLVMRFRQQPSASTLDLPQIAHNQQATLDAFGLANNVTTSAYGTKTPLTGSALSQQAADGAQLRILDPNQLSPTFNVKQQLQAYYGFKSTLDVDRYELNGQSRDVAIAPRELHVNNVSLHSWANSHLVYTHGYGVVAAPTDSLNSASDVPEFIGGGEPTGQQIPVTHPQIYFGQSSPNYSIVGQPAGSTTQLEFDRPGIDGKPAAHTTYDGDGGVPIGSTFRRLLYAAKMRAPSILFSNELNSASQILYLRDPRQRVAAVAPWLTLDGDAYPAIVDGNVEWIVDGYTTSSNYPESQLVNLHQATSSPLVSSGSTVAQPSRNVNYMRNSVKATVDAYTGKVTLYEWNQAAQPDPLLKTWESVFPGLVQPQSAMSTDLLAHVRYPQDLYDVQRQLLTKYHVSDPADFYSGNDFWNVPTDPTVAATQQLNAGNPGTVSTAATSGGPTMASTYMSISPDGYSDSTFALSSPLVTLNRQDLAGFLTVNSEPGPDYGKFTLLTFPSGQTTGSPSQVQNDIESTTKISEALTLQRGGNSKVVLGNLLSLPVGGRMLFVEPIYTQASGSSSFPILRHVVAIYGNGQPAFTTDLSSALREALASGDAAGDAVNGDSGGSGTASSSESGSSTDSGSGGGSGSS